MKKFKVTVDYEFRKLKFENEDGTYIDTYGELDYWKTFPINEVNYDYHVDCDYSTGDFEIIVDVFEVDKTIVPIAL